MKTATPEKKAATALPKSKRREFRPLVMAFFPALTQMRVTPLTDFMRQEKYLQMDQ
jgi:hypothetical protein